MTKPCPNCSALFEPKRWFQKFCTPICQRRFAGKKAWRLHRKFTRTPEKQKQYDANRDPEKRKRSRRAYETLNRGSINASQALYRKNNREVLRFRAKLRWITKPEEMKAKYLAHYSKNKDGIKKKERAHRQIIKGEYDALVELGFATINVPKDFGGNDLSYRRMVVALAKKEGIL